MNLTKGEYLHKLLASVHDWLTKCGLGVCRMRLGLGFKSVPSVYPNNFLIFACPLAGLVLILAHCAGVLPPA